MVAPPPLATPPSASYGPVRLLVVQPTPFCNLDCDYCYLPNRDDRSRLSLEILELAVERVLESPFFDGPFTLLWHAGEPLSAGLPFYDQASALIRSILERRGLPADSVAQAIQTNATVIDQAWCDCFRRNDIHVGVSMDGPAFLHDAHRRTRTGLGSHAATMRGVQWLKRCQIPFHVISVLTADGLDHADTIFDFFVEHGIELVGFNMEETEGENARSSLEIPDAEQRYVAFLQRFWQRIEERPGVLHLREFDGITSLASGEERLQNTDMNWPFVIVNVDVKGNLSTFDPELLSVNTEEFGDFLFGNVRHNSLESILDNEKYQRVAAQVFAGVERCRQSCAYFGLCGGGAGSNKYWEHGSFDCSVTQACRYRTQLVADVALAGMEKALGLAA
jgi:uncharacterized protein